MSDNIDTSNDPYMIVSSDAHAGLQCEGGDQRCQVGRIDLATS